MFAQILKPSAGTKKESKEGLRKPNPCALGQGVVSVLLPHSRGGQCCSQCLQIGKLRLRVGQTVNKQQGKDSIKIILPPEL
jgi:hypothetical protein